MNACVAGFNIVLQLYSKGHKSTCTGPMLTLLAVYYDQILLILHPVTKGTSTRTHVIRVLDNRSTTLHIIMLRPHPLTHIILTPSEPVLL